MCFYKNVYVKVCLIINIQMSDYNALYMQGAVLKSMQALTLICFLQ